MVTAAGVAMANRLPVLLLAGDTFQSRLPDPVLQQVEHFDDPSTTANDAFRARRALLGPHHPPGAGDPVAAAGHRHAARPGGLRAGVPRPAPGRPGARRSTSPTGCSSRSSTRSPRPRPDRAAGRGGRRRAPRARRRRCSSPAAACTTRWPRPSWRRSPSATAIPVVETVAGKSSAAASDHPRYAGPVGVIGCRGGQPAGGRRPTSCVAVGTRLQDFTTGSWSDLPQPGDAARSASTPPGSTPASTSPCRSSATPASRSPSSTRRSATGRRRRRGPSRRPARSPGTGRTSTSSPRSSTVTAQLPTYAQVVGARVSASPRPDDYAAHGAGGFPGELNNGWRSLGIATFDCEYGFSCMGYELSGGWGAAMARSASGPGRATRSCSSATART